MARHSRAHTRTDSAHLYAEGGHCLRMRVGQRAEEAVRHALCPRLGTSHQRRELVVVADQHERAGEAQRPERDGHRHLPGLVEDADVKVLVVQERVVDSQAGDAHDSRAGHQGLRILDGLDALLCHDALASLNQSAHRMHYGDRLTGTRHALHEHINEQTPAVVIELRRREKLQEIVPALGEVRSGSYARLGQMGDPDLEKLVKHSPLQCSSRGLFGLHALVEDCPSGAAKAPGNLAQARAPMKGTAYTQLRLSLAHFAGGAASGSTSISRRI
eukprot:SM000121S26032  [mRNA]  locus=s121:325293:331413:- [translate_table: standard]